MHLDSPNLSEYRCQLKCRKVRRKTSRRFGPIVARVQYKVLVIKQENSEKKGSKQPRGAAVPETAIK